MSTVPNKNIELIKDSVIFQLTDLFGKVLDLKIITAAAEEHNYNLDETANSLLEMQSKSNQKTTENETNTKKIFNSNTTTRPLPIKQEPKTKESLYIDSVINEINRGYKIMILMRGMPGSGKSFLAKKLINETIGTTNSSLVQYDSHIFSTDDYFYRGGFYVFDSYKLGEAHNNNQKRAFDAMNRGISPIIIDNTNTQMWEMKSYATMAMDFCYLIRIVEPDTWWAFNANELTKRNEHDVPKAKIKEMIDRYQKNIKSEELLATYGLVYKTQKPPQLRSFPPFSTFKTIPSENVEKNGQSIVVNKIKIIPRIDKRIKENSSSVENAWGIDEKTLQSWDVVLPLNEYKENNGQSDIDICQPVNNLKSLLNTNENYTITEQCIFDYIQNNDQIALNNFKLLQGYDRDINQGLQTTNFNNIPPQKIKIDKSCMTSDDLQDNFNSLQALFDFFPKIHKRYIIDLFKKCKNNFHWTVDILLDLDLESENQYENYESETIAEDNNNDSDWYYYNRNEEVELENKSKNLIKSKENKPNFRKKKIVNGELMELKKSLETKFDINKEHYSDNLLRIKQLKFGHQQQHSSFSNEPIPSTSKDRELNNCSSNENDSDIEEESLQSHEDLLELNLGEACIKQLENEFVNTGFMAPKGYLPVIQLPKSLARQLYALYFESVYEQMDNEREVINEINKQDEEFAKKLQAEEELKLNKLKSTKKVEDFQEIMDEQIAIKLCENNINKWKNLTVDDLAMKLTKQKLFENFPIVNRDYLLALFHAYDNDYHKTVEELMHSLPQMSSDQVQSLKQPPLSPTLIKEMKDDENDCVEIEGNGNERKTANDYRDEANKYLKKRGELFQKAQDLFSRGMPEAAQLYSDLARKQTQYYERANAFAATSFLEENNKRIGNSDTLDLHFLYVKEAIQALDLFIDRNINALKKGRNVDLYIITGRGKNSVNGKSKIKPCVKNRLQKRQIRYRELNPGLLQITLTMNSPMTCDLE